MNKDIEYMRLALQLAEKGKGSVAPNPMVGCVITKANEIIAQGYHQRYGEAHAEVNAINSLPADFDFTGCTLYVNLEPCSHYGKTPPCSDLIIAKKIKRVVVANLDSNPLVAGKGLEKLKNAGIEVKSGVLNDEARELNKRFFVFHEKKRPYIILKWAETKDGFISKLPAPSQKEDNWITCNQSKELVHLWRSEEQAIMVGTTTVLLDNPELTTRLVKGKNPTRIIVDRELKIPHTAKVFVPGEKTIVITEKAVEDTENSSYCTVSFDKDFVSTLLRNLYLLNIQSVIIEGGSKLLNIFIVAGVWDEARVFVGEKVFEKGLPAPVFNKEGASITKINSDTLYWKKNIL